MLKKLLLATAILLPLALPALAYPECYQVQIGLDMSGPDYDWKCDDDGNINIDDPDLKPNERAVVVRIKAAVDKRREEREEREAKAEEARLAQCTIRFLGLGCPKK